MLLIHEYIFQLLPSILILYRRQVQADAGVV